MATKLIRIGDRYWPLLKRIHHGSDYGQAGEPLPTPDGVEKWKKGAKVWQWNERLQFRGFRLWIQFTQQDNPALFERLPKTKYMEALPGMVDEIIAPDKVKYSFGGVVTARLKVEPFPAEGEPPLSQKEIKEAGEIMDFIRGVSSPAESKTKRKTGARKRGKKHNLKGREKWAVASLIREIRGGKHKQGEEQPTDKEVVAKLLERAKTHPLLKERIMPGVRTLEGWVAIVRKRRTIPGAHR